MSSSVFQIGDRVRLRASLESTVNCPSDRDNNPTAIIDGFLTDIEGSVLMQQDLRGIKYWNVADLRIVTRAPKSKKKS